MRKKLLGVEIDNIDLEQALLRTKSLLNGKEQGYIVTPNPEIIVAASRDEEYQEILNKAFLSLPDGVGIIWASKLLNLGIESRITGVDFVKQLAALATEHGFGLFFLGGFDEVAQKAAENLQKEFPKLNVVGTLGDIVPERDNELAIKRLSQQPVDILLVAFGAPRQEKWIAENLPRIKVKVAVGVGGTFDYLSGKTSRASKTLQNSGLEWLYRLSREPRRIRRQMALAEFVALVFREKYKKRF